MKLRSVELKGNKGIIELADTDFYFINTFRRIMIAELPKLAIEDVIIYDNTSPLFDEIIAHRLGLIPIPTDLDLLNFRAECNCDGKGCPSCTVRYTLSKEEEGVVYSGDLQPETESWAIREDKIPIVELGKDQRIILEVEAILGTGKDHAKWQPVHAPTYQMKVSLTYDEKRLSDVKEFLEEIPSGIIELKGNKLELVDQRSLPVLQSYLDKANVDFIRIFRDPHEFTFTFESDGAMDAKETLRATINILKDKYAEFSEKLTALK